MQDTEDLGMSSDFTQPRTVHIVVIGVVQDHNGNFKVIITFTYETKIVTPFESMERIVQDFRFSRRIFLDSLVSVPLIDFVSIKPEGIRPKGSSKDVVLSWDITDQETFNPLTKAVDHIVREDNVRLIH